MNSTSISLSPSHQRILLVDDSTEVRSMMRLALEQQGYNVEELPSAADLELKIESFKPQLIVCDMLMPGRDGLSVLQALHEHESTRDIPFIFATAKNFPGDKKAALQAGVASYLVKPFSPEALLEAVHDALAVQVGVCVWGCRGAIAAPEKAMGRFGGNTSCLELILPMRESGNRRLIFDAGTGIRALGNSIAPHLPLRASLFLTHFHWDHIQGLPFFKPLYRPGNEITIYGPATNDAGLLETIQGQMGGAFFPVSTDAFLSSVTYCGLQEEDFDVDGVHVSTFSVMHPGFTIGYKIMWGDYAVAYVPDNELLPEWTMPEVSVEALRFANWLGGVNLLIHDCQYSAASYESHRGWGHSGATALAALVAHVGVKQVLLFHHDPDNEDEAVEHIHEEFRRELERREAGHIISALAAEGTFYPVA